jgi:hypothetical protein
VTRKEIESLVALWQKRLGLEGWRIVFVWDSEPESDEEKGEAIAEVDAQSVPYRRSHMRFARKVEEWPREAWGEHGAFTADEVIVHELLHLAQRDCDRAAMDLDDGHLHRDAYEIRNSAYHEARERFVDDLARALVAAFEG